MTWLSGYPVDHLSTYEHSIDLGSSSLNEVHARLARLEQFFCRIGFVFDEQAEALKQEIKEPIAKWSVKISPCPLPTPRAGARVPRWRD